MVVAGHMEISLILESEVGPVYTGCRVCLLHCLMLTQLIRETTGICYWHARSAFVICGWLDSFCLTPRPPLPPEICGQSDQLPLKNDKFDQYLLITSRPQELAKKFNHQVDHTLSSEL